MLLQIRREELLSSQNQFDASGSLAGYLYQCRLALLLGLQTVKKKPNGQITIEKFDDIAFDTDDHVECLIQSKHSISPKQLTDNSVDFWKTLRIWIENFKLGVIANSDTRRLLITNATAPAKSAASMLRPDTSLEMRRNAREILKKIAKTSTNTVTQIARSAFLSLNDSEIDLLFGSINIIDSFPNLPSVLDDIEGELRILAPSHSEKVTEMLEGWWFRVIAKRLVGDDDKAIALQDILRKANEIGGYFKPDGLPVYTPEELGDRPYAPEDEAEIYVKQMRLINLPDTAISRSIRDFYRANAQRSNWIREGLLIDGEASRYDATLQDHWERRFEQECIGVENTNLEDKCEIGRKVYFWSTRHEVSFRNVVEKWITAGSFQSLSDQLKVGWHPHFKHHLKKEDDDGTS